MLMETQITNEKIQEVADKIVKEYQPEKIILFGSYAWGKPHEDSDVDLFIVKDEKKTRLEMIREVNRIIFGTGEAVDALVYTPEHLEKRKLLGDPFVLKIINEGKLLYGAK